MPNEMVRNVTQQLQTLKPTFRDCFSETQDYISGISEMTNISGTEQDKYVELLCDSDIQTQFKESDRTNF